MTGNNTYTHSEQLKSGYIMQLFTIAFAVVALFTSGLFIGERIKESFFANMSPPVLQEESLETPEKVLAENKDALRCLGDKSWETLSQGRRLQTARAVALVESANLQLFFMPRVVPEELSLPVIANYDADERTISLNSIYLEDCTAEELVCMVAHEVFHAAQKAAVSAYDEMDDRCKNLPMFSDVRKLKEEFSNYEDGMSNPESYRNQTCETEAKEYEEQRVAWYAEAGYFD